MFEVTNPANGDVIQEIPDGGREEAARAIDAAYEAFPARAAATAYDRSAILYRAWQLMIERKDHLARTMTEEQGKPLARRDDGSTVCGGLRCGSRRRGQTSSWRDHPVGAARPTLYRHASAGRCRCRGDPLELSGLHDHPQSRPGARGGLHRGPQAGGSHTACAIETFKILEEAGVPKGVINLVTAKDPAPVGEEFVTNPKVAKLTFTGSTAVGKMLAGKAAANMKRVSRELGGHAPFMVFDDANPIHAAKGAQLVKFLNTGQACISPNRMYVSEKARR